MRHATVLLDSRGSDRYLLAPSRFVAEHPDVRGGTIEHVNTLADGSAITLMWFRASLETVRSYVDGAGAGIATDVAPAPDGVVLYSHFEPAGTSEVLLGLRQRHEVVFDVPMTFTADGEIRAPIVGREGAIQAAIDGMADEIEVTLEAITEYNPAVRGPLATLTDRQLETLRLAVERGYYESPRGVTAADLADELGCSRGAVSEHLRKAERYVLSDLVE